MKASVQLSELRGLEVFDWIPHDRMNLLSRHMTELRVGKGEILYRPGQPAKDLFCVLEGAVGLSLLASKGNYLRLGLLARGEFFGISALVPGWRRVSRAMALGESRVGIIDAKIFVSEICAMPWNTFTALTQTMLKPLLTVSLRRSLFLVEVNRPSGSGPLGICWSSQCCNPKGTPPVSPHSRRTRRCRWRFATPRIDCA